jgi:hypothetical protein
MVLFEWEKKSNVPIELNARNMAVWDRYEQFRERFWDKLMSRPSYLNQSYLEVMEHLHERYQQNYGGYPFRSLHEKAPEVYMLTKKAEVYKLNYILYSLQVFYY